MPMVDVRTPSLGLTQLKAIIDESYADSIECDIHYVNHAFAAAIGLDIYNIFVSELNSGIGEWLFRQVAFPDESGNSEIYFQRYYTGDDPENEEIRDIVTQLRPQLPGILDSFIDTFNLTAYDVVGFTSLFHQNTASLAMCRLLKQYNPDVITLLGGFNVDYPMGVVYLENFSYIDYVFSGPALLSIQQWCDNYLQGSLHAAGRIPGVFSKHNNPDAVSQNYGERLDINYKITLNYDSYIASFKKYFSNSYIKPYLLYATAEGCYWGEKNKCTFCAQGGPCGNDMQFKTMHPQNAIALINSMQRYKDDVAFMYATDNIIAPHYPEQVYKHIKSAIPIHLEMSTYNLDQQKIALLSNAGVKVTEAGVESLLTRSLQLMRKGSTASRNLRFLMDCHLNDVFVVWNYLLGVPGEDAAMYEAVYDMLPQLVHFYPADMVIVTFERFSEYYRNPDTYQLQLAPYPFYKMTYPFPQEEISNLAYDFYNMQDGEYKQGLKQWIGRLEQRFEDWKQQWNPISKTYPMLYFYQKYGVQYIYDSRNGNDLHIKLSDAEYTILQELYKPQTIEGLQTSHESMVTVDLLEDLLHRGLLFQDGSRFYTIVYPAKPAAPTFFV